MDKLAEIMAHTRQQLEKRMRPVRESELSRLGERTRAGKSFADALRRDGLAVISEVKRRSPSAGDIAPGVDAVEQARLYYNAGADALSILTDEKYFGGSIRDLWSVNDLLTGRKDAPPTLRKDFFVHPLQVVEAAEAGARCILIIVRALTDEEIGALWHAAELAAMDAIFEVHDEADLERALQQDAKIVGVNNRDLARFVTDLSISERLIPQIPDACLSISESGIRSLEDAVWARDCGADAVLIGEALMRMKEPEAFVEQLHQLE